MNSNTIKVNDIKDIPENLRENACAYTLYDVVLNYTDSLGNSKEINAEFVFNCVYASIGGTWSGYVNEKEIDLKYLRGFHGDFNDLNSFSDYMSDKREYNYEIIKKTLTKYAKKVNNNSEIDNVNFDIKVVQHVIGYPHYEKTMKQTSFFDGVSSSSSNQTTNTNENVENQNEKQEEVIKDQQISLF